MPADRSFDFVKSNSLVRRYYMGRLYPVLVFLFFPLLVAVPFFLAGKVSLVFQLFGLIALLLVVFMVPDWLTFILPKNTVIAKRDGSIVYLFLEREYEIDLDNTREIDVGTGLFPINRLSIRVMACDGQSELIKTRFQLVQLVRFLGRLKS